MNILLDTHIAVWSVMLVDRLTSEVRDLIVDPANDVYVSAASIWEIGIKYELGRSGAPPFGGEEAIRQFENADYVLMDIQPRQVAAASRLPRHHADPFDRLLVAQALEGPYRLITRDPTIARYSDSIILMR
ncbi:MAG: type II toxin-antitoxin system VapC family toxin [Alphaproteobacteria bacterium]|nr:type II toxin-antitoxin system VapC family toxin [Alphaproteobacteria bacterium]